LSTTSRGETIVRFEVFVVCETVEELTTVTTSSPTAGGVDSSGRAATAENVSTSRKLLMANMATGQRKTLSFTSTKLSITAATCSL
jgi:hypothetical protein